jgi:hypothetical protein
MRFHIGPVPTNEEFHPAETGWSKLKEPTPWVAQLMAVPVAFGAGALVLVGWSSLVGSLPTFGETHSLGVGSALILLLAVLLTIPIHELVHMLVHPGSGRSSASILGFWPATLLFYAHYDAALTPRRFLLILAAPFVALSVLPVLASALVGWNSRTLFVVAAFNALAASVDLLGLVIISTQVPRGAVVRNLGYYTWWHVPSAPAPPIAQGGTRDRD